MDKQEQAGAESATGSISAFGLLAEAIKAKKTTLAEGGMTEEAMASIRAESPETAMQTMSYIFQHASIREGDVVATANRGVRWARELGISEDVIKGGWALFVETALSKDRA